MIVHCHGHGFISDSGKGIPSSCTRLWQPLPPRRSSRTWALWTSWLMTSASPVITSVSHTQRTDRTVRSTCRHAMLAEVAVLWRQSEGDSVQQLNSADSFTASLERIVASISGARKSCAVARMSWCNGIGPNATCRRCKHHWESKWHQANVFCMIYS